MRRTLMLVLASAVAMFAFSAAPAGAQADEFNRTGGEVRLVHGGSYYSYHRGWDRWDHYRPGYGGPVIVRPAPPPPPVIVVPSRPSYYHPPHYYHHDSGHGGFSLFGRDGGFSIRW